MNIRLLISFFLLLSLQGFGQAFKFEHLIFHTSKCFGTCPTLHLKLDSNRNIWLYAEKVFKYENTRSFEKDSSKMGYFTGKLNKKTFSRLLKELQTVNIDSLDFPEIFCCDGPIRTIIIYYNGKRKYLKSMYPPENAEKLIAILMEIISQKRMRKTTEIFDLEK